MAKTVVAVVTMDLDDDAGFDTVNDVREHLYTDLRRQFGDRMVLNDDGKITRTGLTVVVLLQGA